MLAPIDIFFLLILVASVLIGVWRGFVFEALTLLSWVAAFVVSLWLAPVVSGQLSVNWPQPAKYATAYAVIFLITVFVCGGVAALMRKFVGTVGLSVIDRGVGFFFGFLRGIIILLVITQLMTMSPWRDISWWSQGVGPQLTEKIMVQISPLFSRFTGDHFNQSRVI
jgi:uncharacterized membrane protein required for colicin V production